MVVPVKDTVGLFAEEARSTCQSQCGQARAPRSSYRDVVQPVDDPSYVYPRRGGQLLKAGLLQAPVASLAQPEGSYSLRNRPFYACPPGVETSELFGFLSLSGGLDSLVLFLGLQGEGAREVLGSRARRSARACAAIVRGEVDVDHTSPPSGLGFRPTDALALPGTGHRLLFPIDAEVRHVEAFVCFGLPGVVLEGRADEIDPAGVARNEVAPTNVGRVRQL